MNYISLKEWASAHGIDPATARQRAGRGPFRQRKRSGGTGSSTRMNR